MRHYSQSGLPNPLAIAAIVGVALLSLFGFDESGQFVLTAEPTAAERHAGAGQTLAPDSPRQAQILPAQSVALPRGYVAEAVATFEATGLVLGRKRYPRTRDGWLAPVDLALGWGPMSNPDTLSHFRLWQDSRFLYFTASSEAPISPDMANRTSANVHIVPATPEARAQLERVRKGDLVRVTGRLVNVSGPGGFTWTTSLTRTDTGFGACELLLLDRVEVLPATDAPEISAHDAPAAIQPHLASPGARAPSHAILSTEL
ncbi:MAG: hypothetical protein AAFU80_24145 [Pseudomonadota bacterium]